MSEDNVRQMTSQAWELLRQGAFQQAIELAWQACEEANYRLGNPFLYADCLRELADMMYLLGQFDLAQKYYGELLHLQQILAGREVERAETFSKLANTVLRQGKLEEAEQLFEDALTAQRAVLPAGHPDFATTLNFLGILALQRKAYTQAEMSFAEALSIVRPSQNFNRIEKAAATQNLADVYIGMQAYDRAEPLLLESLGLLREEGDKQQEVATVLYKLAEVKRGQGRRTAAVGLYEQALEIWRPLLKPTDTNISSSVLALAELYEELGNYPVAVVYRQEAVDILRGLTHADDPLIGEQISSLGALYLRLAKFEAAETQFREAIDLFHTAYGEGDQRYAEALNNLAEVFRQSGRYALALPLYKQALAIAGKAPIADPTVLLIVLNNYALLADETGNHRQAQQLYEVAVSQLEHTVDQQHPLYATTLNNYALHHYKTGNYGDAELLYRKVLTIRRDMFGEAHPDVALSYNVLGQLFQDMGNLDEAEELYTWALSIRRKMLGDRHPSTALTLNNLGGLYLQRQLPDKAVPLLEQALAVRQALYGDEHHEVAQSLHNLASAYKAQGRFSEVERLLVTAGRIWREQLGEHHPWYISNQGNLALWYAQNGNAAKGEELLRNAIAGLRATLGDRHPHIAGLLGNLAAFCVVRGAVAEALQLMHESARLNDRLLGHMFAIGSERRQLNYLRTLRTEMFWFLTLAQMTQGSQHAAFDLVLRRKALTAETLAWQREAVLGGHYPDLEDQLRELSNLKAEIARKTLAGPGDLDGATYRQLLIELDDRREVQEERLARQIPEMDPALRPQAANCHAIAAHLPMDGVLVEYFRFWPYKFADAFQLNGDPWDPPRYIAFVLHCNDPEHIQMLDLGAAEPIDRLIHSWRSAVTGRSEQQRAAGDNEDPSASTANVRDVVRQGARHLGNPPTTSAGLGREEGAHLRALIFDPLLPALNGCKRLLITPDGDLGLLPFEALPLGDDRYLLDEYTISYLGVGRDVLRLDSFSSRTPNAPLVISDPDYDLGAETVPTFTRDTPFHRLSGVSAEGRAIADLLQTKPLVQSEALESHLRSHRSPIILHIATHGFFEPYTTDHPGAFKLGELTFARWEGRLEQLGLLVNPLIRSGLALAGANTWAQEGTPPEAAEDGILTAEDVTGLDLLDTELAVLSACDTGLGQVEAGEGVFGLRRAFTIAGANTLVMSLWKVPDQQTRDVMTLFYKALLQGKSRIEALREAQLDIRRRHPEPFYWGAFICQGKTGPLRDIAQWYST